MDPRDPFRQYPGVGMGGLASYMPVNSLGCSIGLIVLLVLVIAFGAAQGPLLAVAVVGIIVLLLFARRAMKRELRRDDRDPATSSLQGTLPEDSNLSDEERRQAMRRIRGEEDDAPPHEQ